ncbi:response regulator [Planococcus sp. X10-3]|uniref:response regulator n=1 Tax=Planococcus sp. X10-3 TaxID=3061240 RepID=UPI003BAF4186
MDNYQKINLLLIDSNPILRGGLKRILELDKGLQVVAEGDNGEQLLSLYTQYRPDVVIIDPNFPYTEGMAALRELIQHFPDSKVLVFTVAAEFKYVSQVIMERASGYLLKEMDAPSIINAVQAVVKGEFYLYPKLTTDFLSEYKKMDERKTGAKFFQSDIRRPYHLLTTRESEVLQLLAEGHSNKTLGETLGVSDKTIKNHVSTILRKLDLSDRTQAVVTALKNGWIELK